MTKTELIAILEGILEDIDNEGRLCRKKYNPIGDFRAGFVEGYVFAEKIINKRIIEFKNKVRHYDEKVPKNLQV